MSPVPTSASFICGSSSFIGPMTLVLGGPEKVVPDPDLMEQTFDRPSTDFELD